MSELSLNRSSGEGWLGFKAGVIPLNPDFVRAPILDVYVHSAFNNTLNIVSNDLPINPYAALGGVVEVLPRQDLSLRYGWFDLNSTEQLANWLGRKPGLASPGGGSAHLLQFSYEPTWLAPAAEQPIRGCRHGSALKRRSANCRNPVDVQSQLPGGLLSVGGFLTSAEGQGLFGSVTLRSGLRRRRPTPIAASVRSAIAPKYEIGRAHV